MPVAVFSTKAYDRTFLDGANEDARHRLSYIDSRLTHLTVPAAKGAEAVCAFGNDQLDAAALQELKGLGIRLVALRCAGFNNVDLQAASRLGITVARVPDYSPHYVAEHAVALMLALNRKIHRAYARVREGNFALDGLMGFDLHGRSVGIIGTGKIGALVARIMTGFGCRVMAYDPAPSPECLSASAMVRSTSSLRPPISFRCTAR
jgi:D-lactate dehydrogenase